MSRFDSLRNRLLILFASLSFILGLSITIYLGYIASAQMTKNSGQSLYIAAKNISTTLATSLTEREREITLLSQSPLFTESDFSNPGRVKLEVRHKSPN